MQSTTMQNLDKIENLLSPKKVFVYKDKFNEEWFRVYKSELRNAQKIFIHLHFLEIFLRNKVSSELKNDFGSEFFYKNSVLRFNLKEREKIDKVFDELSKLEKEASLDNIISALNFGFWTNIFHKNYNYSIWQNNKMLNRVFPFFKPHQRDLKKIWQEMEIIRKLRNRIFHFENLQDCDFDSMCELIEKFIYAISGMRFTEIFNQD